jgi:bacterioferritin-associated ferredoxin
MYVCLCKGLKEADVALAARACAERGKVELEDVIEVLGLHCEEACGFCVENPEIIEAIVGETISDGDHAQAPFQPSPS